MTIETRDGTTHRDGGCTACGAWELDHHITTLVIRRDGGNSAVTVRFCDMCRDEAIAVLTHQRDGATARTRTSAFMRRIGPGHWSDGEWDIVRRDASGGWACRRGGEYHYGSRTLADAKRYVADTRRIEAP